MVRKYVNEHVLVKDIQSLAYNIYLRQKVFNQGLIPICQKICEHQDIRLSLPVGYFHAADCFIIGKRNLEPGLELLVLRVKVASVTLGDFPV
jgi:hypothetical protein